MRESEHPPPPSDARILEGPDARILEGPDARILEGIVTTRNEDGSVNISPMGPWVDGELSAIQLRPFGTSRTLANLLRRGEGVLHVSDNVELLARAAINRWDRLPEVCPAAVIAGDVLIDVCRWYEFRVRSIDTSAQRAEILADIVHRGRQRDFFGFNRAKHAVVEAAILATRVHLIGSEDLHAELDRLRPLVEKTAGEQERRAFALLCQYIQERTDSP